MVTQTKVAQAEPAEMAAQTVKGIKADINSAELDGIKAYDILDAVKDLEKGQQQPVVAELATRLGLRHLASTTAFYPEFEGVLWAHFAGMDDLQEHVSTAVTTGQIDTSTLKMYFDYLQSMFRASGKTRMEFYSKMITEASVQEDIASADFGKRALDFHRKVRSSVHREHLLVLYSVELILKLYRAHYPEKGSSVSEETLEAVYKYFEHGMPLGTKFIDYTEDDTFLSYSLEEGRLSEIN